MRCCFIMCQYSWQLVGARALAYLVAPGVLTSLEFSSLQVFLLEGSSAEPGQPLSSDYYILLCKRRAQNNAHHLPAPTCGAPSFQLVLLGVCLGEDLIGVDSLKASFQSRSTKGLLMFMSAWGVQAGCASFVEAIGVKAFKACAQGQQSSFL